METIEHLSDVAELTIDDHSGETSRVIAEMHATLNLQDNADSKALVASVNMLDDYRDSCTLESRDPEKQYPGKLALRMPPDLHSNVASPVTLAYPGDKRIKTNRLQRVAHG
jgi:hypothetical protein